MERKDSIQSHRYRGVQADKTFARFAFDSNDGNTRASCCTIRASKAYHLDELLWLTFHRVCRGHALYAWDETISKLRGHMNLPTRSLTILFGKAMQHHSRCVVFWVTALSGCCFWNAGLWTKPQYSLAFLSSRIEKMWEVNWGQWISPIGHQEFDPQGTYSSAIFKYWDKQ